MGGVILSRHRAAELETCQLQRQCRVDPGVKPSTYQPKRRAGRSLKLEETAKLPAVLDYIDELNAWISQGFWRCSWPAPLRLYAVQ
ncbi:hypothetical protein [Escherichia coli]|uniref:hypothetical protein n=1 Tax=Escherichia coli TaxID=562 RepID=UPI003786FF1A